MVVQYIVGAIAVGVIPKLEQTLIPFKVDLDFLWALNNKEEAISDRFRSDFELLLELEGIELFLIKCEN